MARVFLDTNYFIDAIHRKPEKYILESLENHIIYISTLSIHIYCYSSKIKIPDEIISAQKEKFQLIDFGKDVLENALLGPTSDFEDNVQLHSAAEAECDFFLTNDEAPATLRSRYLLPVLRRERNPSEAERDSHSSLDLRPRFSAEGDKQLLNMKFFGKTQILPKLP